MSGNPVFLLELLIFSGAALAWAGWELWSVRRSKDDKATSKDGGATDSSPGEPGHPER